MIVFDFCSHKDGTTVKMKLMNYAVDYIRFREAIKNMAQLYQLWRKRYLFGK